MPRSFTLGKSAGTAVPEKPHGLRKLADRKSDFIMAAAHQLKSPIAIMQWSLQSVLELGAVDVKSRKHVSQALMQANAMSQMVGDMLHLVRLVAHNEDVSQMLEPVAVQKVLDESIAQHAPLAQKSSAQVVQGPREVLPAIYAESMYLKQAVDNLIDNAIRYSPNGGVITVSATHKGQAVEISVADQGIGIPESEHSRLFSEFFRGEQAKALRHDGTGLGLALVKHITEAFGGTVHLQSALGKGTTITLSFPVK